MGFGTLIIYIGIEACVLKLLDVHKEVIAKR